MLLGATGVKAVRKYVGEIEPRGGQLFIARGPHWKQNYLWGPV